MKRPILIAMTFALALIAPAVLAAPPGSAKQQEAVWSYVEVLGDAGAPAHTAWATLQSARITRMRQPAFKSHAAAVADCNVMTKAALEAVRKAKPPPGLGPYAGTAADVYRHGVKAVELRLDALDAARLAMTQETPEVSARYEARSAAASDEYAATGRIIFALATTLGRDPWSRPK